MDEKFEISNRHFDVLKKLTNLMFEHFCYEKCKYEKHNYKPDSKLSLDFLNMESNAHCIQIYEQNHQLYQKEKDIGKLIVNELCEYGRVETELKAKKLNNTFGDDITNGNKI